MSVVEPAEREDGFREELVELALSLPLGDLAALARLAALCDRPDATALEAALEAGRDESFAALLLRLVNSASSGSATHIADLPRAITRLGFRHVQALAIAAPGLRLLRGPADGLGDARHELHRHSVRVGLAARLLTPAGVDPDRALAAGILHNIGLSVIALYAPHEFRFLLDAAGRGEELWPHEESIFGFSHAELGALLAERWSYPPELVVAIRDHDSPDPETELAAVVRLADQLVRAHGIGVEPKRSLPWAIPEPTMGLARADAQLSVLLGEQDLIDAHADEPSEEAAHEHAHVSPRAFAQALDELA